MFRADFEDGPFERRLSRRHPGGLGGASPLRLERARDLFRGEGFDDVAGLDPLDPLSTPIPSEALQDLARRP